MSRTRSLDGQVTMHAVGRLSETIDLVSEPIVRDELGVAGATILLLAQDNSVHALKVSVPRRASPTASDKPWQGDSVRGRAAAEGSYSGWSARASSCANNCCGGR